MLFQGRNNIFIQQIIRRMKQPQLIQFKRVPSTEGYFKDKGKTRILKYKA